jgi:peptidoglycan/xylan/chitin deacetylase (PgdA/CDA1 family)
VTADAVPVTDASRWPEGKSSALCVSFDFDGEAPHLWRTRNDPPADITELEQRRYGPRRGVYNVLGMLAELGIRATFFVPGWIAAHYRGAVDEIVAGGHELALHGWCHESPGELSREELRESLTRASELLAEISGVVPVGYRSPSWQMTRQSLEVITEMGLIYDSSLMGEDRPYRMGDLIQIPVDWVTDDAIYYRYNRGAVVPPTPAGGLAANWAGEIAAAVARGTLCTLTAHPWQSGRPARIEALTGVLAGAKENEGLWIGTVGDLARHSAGLAGLTSVDLATLTRPDDMRWPEA